MTMEGGAGDTFFEKYELGEVFGKGIHLISRTCTNQKTGQQLAVKIINLSKFNQKHQQMLIKNLKREEELSEELRHNLVVPILEVYYNDSLYYMLHEYMEGADLCLEIVNRALSGFVYSEAVASHYMKQVLEALRYCHSKNILHRDLRLHSISLMSRENSSPVKLGNFSSAVAVEELESTSRYNIDQELICDTQTLTCTEKDRFGYLSSPGFPAPEMMTGQYYGKPVDVWSAGCILYLLLCGSPPFLGRMERRDQSALSCAYVLDNKQWSEVSEEAKTLIRRMLEPIPSRRITVDDALKEPWIKDRSRVPKLHLSETVKAMQKFNDFRILKDLTISTALDPHWSRSANCSSQILSNVSNRIDVGLGGAQDVLRYLEDVEALENCDHLPAEVFEELTLDQRFNSCLKLFEGIQSRMFSLRTAFRHESSSQQLMELLDHLSKRCRNSVEDVKTFCDLATSPHLQALFQAHDLIASKLNAATALRLADRHDQSGASMLAVNGNFKESSIPRQGLPYMFPGGDQSTLRGLNSTFEGNNNNPDASLGFVPGRMNNNNNSYKASPASGGSFEALGSEESVQTGRPRVVQFLKNSEEPLGITLKVNEVKKCVVSRILDGGMIHRHGTLHAGDEICEINGKKVEGETVEALQKLLKDCRGTITFKIVPSSRNPPLHSEIFVKSLFSYDPSLDSFIPSQDAGLKFKVGDVLRVVSRDDTNWWQARPWDAPKNQPARLVPSPQLQEMRIFTEDQARKKNAQGWWLTRRRKGHKDKYLAKHNSLFDQLELVTYEEVVRLPYFARKTLVLLGAHGVGRRHIKNMLITHQSHKFAYPIPHTDRPPRPGEEHGLNYFFVPYDLMTSEIKDNQFLEYGTHEGALYGTKLDTIKQIHKQGLIAILDVEPQALKILRTAEFAPFVVFIAAPKNISLMDSKQMERLVETSDMLERTYQHLFDLKIVNNEINETIRELEIAVETVMANPQWVPVGWLY